MDSCTHLKAILIGAQILVGDCRDILRTLPAGSVQCCVTSPPYWGLRDYGTATWEGGEKGCDHRQTDEEIHRRHFANSTLDGGQKTQRENANSRYKCKCGARRIDAQLGLEPTPEEYITKMVSVFREVWRVLRDDGTLWIVIGDSYCSTAPGTMGDKMGNLNLGDAAANARKKFRPETPTGLKPKDLCGIPWRLAFALQADGWYLRSDIIWHKPNPMPESVTDRPTKSHEYVFLLAKGQSRSRTIALLDCEPERIHFSRNLGAQNSYTGTSGLCIELATTFFDIAQQQSDFSLPPFYSEKWQQGSNSSNGSRSSDLPAVHRAAAHSARLLNSDTSTKEFLCEIHGLWGQLTKANHLLVASRLAESPRSPCAFIDRDGAIAINDSGKVSKVDFIQGNIIVTVPTNCNYFYDAEAIKEARESPMHRNGWNAGKSYAVGPMDRGGHSQAEYPDRMFGNADGRNKRSVWTVATQPYKESHFAVFPEDLIKPCIMAGSRIGDTVLDPFGGSGTTGKVALELGRSAILIELNPDYAELARARTNVTPGFL